MKKLLVVLFCITILGGCSHNNTENPVNKDNAEKNSTTTNDIKSSDTVTPSSDVIIDDSSVSSDSPVATETLSSQTAVNTDNNSSQVSNENSIFTGVIGSAKVHMNLNIIDDNISGYYYYDKYGTNINLTGSIQQDYKDYSTVSMYENTDIAGELIGIKKSKDYIEGYWKHGDTIYPMYLIREGSSINPPEEAEDYVKQFDGHWNGMNTQYFSGTELDIKVLFEDLIYYELYAYNGTHSGVLEGLAVCQARLGTTIFNDHIQWDDDTSDNVKYQFKFNDGRLTLLSNNYEYYCGMGVNFDNSYSKKEIKVSRPSAMDVGIVDNKKDDDLFYSMTRSYYNQFIDNTQSVMYEESILDGKTVDAGESYLRGNSGNCYYINASGYLYAAIIDDDHIEYFTNDPNYTNHMPQPMEEWSKKFDTYINYNNIEMLHLYDSNIIQSKG